MDIIWNPWHGCEKYSEGCLNCYVYRRDGSVGRDASRVEKNADFDLPLRRNRDGAWKIPDGANVFCCMTSDFFLPAADAWREEIWAMMRARPGVRFSVITKRIVRFYDVMPPDWGNGYPNLCLYSTVESDRQAKIRMPVFAELPAAEKGIICEPLLSAIDLTPWLDKRFSLLVCGGESGMAARVCDYNWVLGLREQCKSAEVSFHFKQTGARFLKDGVVYRVPRAMQHKQARAAGIDLHFPSAHHILLPHTAEEEQLSLL